MGYNALSVNAFNELLQDQNLERCYGLPKANVIEAKGVSKAFGDKLLFDNLEFNLPPAGIVGIIGPNGAGKTTLFRLIMGSENADGGTFSVGETVKIGYVDQSHAAIDPEKTVFEVISGGLDFMNIGGRQVNARAYVARFNFTGADQEKNVACFLEVNETDSI